MKILFMGTPDFAQKSLSSLFDSGENIVGVITQPDRPRGRGHTITPPPVKVYAESKSLPVYQPISLSEDNFRPILENLCPELIIVVAYGKILPRYVLDFPKFGCINVHASLLPRYRGAAPIQRAIMNGESVTGITTMYMEAGLDTGDMLKISKTDITPEDDFKSLHDKLSALGAKTLLQTLLSLKEGTLTATKQNDSLATYAAKIEKEDCIIDFSKSAKSVYDTIRALSPMPLAYSRINANKQLKIVKAGISAVYAQGEAGTIVSLDTSGNGKITVACKDGCIDLLTVLPQGKGQMSAADFIRGRQITLGDILHI